jgi:hypothetical protein
MHVNSLILDDAAAKVLQNSVCVAGIVAGGFAAGMPERA